MTKERGGALIFLAVGIYGVVYSSALPLGHWNEPGPGVFPLIVSILLCACGIGWFIRGKATDKKTQAGGLGDFVRKYDNPLRIVGLTAAFIVALQPVGYLLAATLYLFVLFLWVSRYRVPVAALLALVAGPASWFLFGRLLATPLPPGLLGL
jgi:putative tricarboxylic transport membrane protein